MTPDPGHGAHWAQSWIAREIAKAKGSEMTDAECAQRLLDRLNRSVAAHFDAENLHSAERMLNVKARQFLQEVIDLDTRSEGNERK